jgi:hypothetical protein
MSEPAFNPRSMEWVAAQLGAPTVKDEGPPSIPYRPLPPICTIPVEQRAPIVRSGEPVELTGRKPLTGDQLVNWRKMFPLAMFLSDAEINQFRDQLQDEVDRK